MKEDYFLTNNELSYGRVNLPLVFSIYPHIITLQKLTVIYDSFYTHFTETDRVVRHP